MSLRFSHCRTAQYDTWARGQAAARIHLCNDSVNADHPSFVDVIQPMLCTRKCQRLRPRAMHNPQRIIASKGGIKDSREVRIGCVLICSMLCPFCGIVDNRIFRMR